jgi:hypothetical protein
MASKDGWTLEREHDKVQLGKKQYRNMEEWTRPCAVCAEKFSIFVRTNGAGVNASFGLKTCRQHRGQLSAAAAGPGVENIAALRAENEKLKTQLQNVNSYCASLERVHKEQFEELQVVEARLAKYELQPAMEAMSEAHTTNGVAQESLAFPWAPS